MKSKLDSHFNSFKMHNKKSNILILSIKIIVILVLFLLIGIGNSFVTNASEGIKKTTSIKAFRTPAYKVQYKQIDKEKVFFSGRVVSNFGKPIDSAEVNINGEPMRTDSNGFFSMALKKKKTKDKNRYVMNIRKEGYGLLSRIYDSGIQNKIWIMTKATSTYIDPTVNNRVRDTMRGSDVCVGTLSSRVDWPRYPYRRIPRFIDRAGNISENVSDAVKQAITYVENGNTCNPGISLSLSANTLVDSNGNSPEGKVLVSISTVDIYDPDSMPGDYSVIQDNGTGYMVTYGAGTIDITSKGKTYQLKKGKYATLEVPINSAQLKRGKKLEREIPFLLYDEKNGVWKVTGKAELNKKRNAYIAKIYHLSTMNMDLVKTNQACVRIESSAIDIDYSLEVTVPGEDPRTFDVDNTPEKLHVIYNLPNNMDISLRAFSVGGMFPTPITDTIVINTGNPQNPQTPNLPPYPYIACDREVKLERRSLAPVLELYSPPDSTGTFTLKWEYTWPGGLASTSDGYILEKSTVSSSSGFTEDYRTAGQTAPDYESPKYYTSTEAPGTYYYRVKAIKNSVPSPYSNVVQVVVSAPGVRQLKITNLVGSQGLDDIIQVKVIPVNTNFTYSDLLTNDRDTDGDICFELPGESIEPNQARTFDITIGNNYWVFIGLGKWEMDTGTPSFPGNCLLSEPWAKRRYFLESITSPMYYPWVEVHVTDHLSGVWEWSITGSYTTGNLYLNPAGSQSIPFYITTQDPIP